MMDRRAFLGTLALFAAPRVAVAQPAGKVWRVGYLSVASADLDGRWLAAFRQGLRELGYEERKNIVIEQRHAGGRPHKLPDLVADPVRLKVDVFVVYGAGLTVPAIKRATSTTPIVMAVAADPVGEGLVASLAHPRGNVTRLADAHADLAPKRPELLKAVVPGASRVAVLRDGSSPSR